MTIAVRSVDDDRTPWSSSAVFRADAAGRIDLDRAPALTGSYAGVWGMGLIATMQPAGPAPLGGYFWGNGPQTFRLAVLARGRALASTVVRRSFSVRPLRLERETLSGEGFLGTYGAPVGAKGRPAILALGGSNGGPGPILLAGLLAAHGYPTLAVGYFKDPGLPGALSRIPLEYFAKALAWLRRQPEVDPGRILTLGISRGSEAALLLGVQYPDLVHGVVASVPSNVALCAYPGCFGPAWTLGGKPVPYTMQFDDPHPTDDPAAVIPVERIRGPVFLDCAGQDEVWTSCPYARAIVQRLDAHHDRYRHVLVDSPQAGHGVGSFVPYEPTAPQALGPDLGLAVPDEQAREQLWPELLAFLGRL